MSKELDDKKPFLDDLYAINKAIRKPGDFKKSLDELVRSIRPVFIFDNLVAYRCDPKTKSLDVIYAKAIGRGKSAEADVSWGENLANQVVASREVISQVPKEPRSEDRLQLAYLLGLPLMISDEIFGALVFIRFGGPAFSPEHVDMAEFISSHFSWLLFHKIMLERISHLEAQKQASQLQEDFINTITHELRNPLGFIKGYTTTLLRSDAKWNEKTQKEFLVIIDEETDSLQELIENLLDSARLQSGQLPMDFQAVRLDALMNDVIMRSKSYHPDLKILLDVADDLPPIQGDPRRLSQVFENLLSNTVKYAPGSDVLITIKPKEAGALISVKDNGEGIPAQYLPHLFERFFRVPGRSPTIHGSGLGLFICKQIIQSHHGTIIAESEIGQGTNFNIWLPSQSTNPITS